MYLVTQNTDLQISYAQNFEDLILLRCFKDIRKGFYIDIGAQDPVSDSVTNLFYLRGWTGINIEPAIQYFTRLQKQRIRDINLNIAISDHDSDAKFFEVPDSGLSTLDLENASDMVKHQVHGIWRTVQTKTLNSVLIENSILQDIEFLKIDVEGFEAAVLSGIDFEAYRPKVILVEAVKPNSTILNDQDWNEILFRANYLEVYFDGLNKYFLRKESSDLKKNFDRPIGYLDKFIRYTEQSTINELEIEKVKNEAEYKALNLAFVKQRHEYEGVIKALRSSTIWRLTTPLRALITTTKKIFLKLLSFASLQPILRRFLEHSSGKWLKDSISRSALGIRLKKSPSFHRFYGDIRNANNVFPNWVFGKSIEIDIKHEILKYQTFEDYQVNKTSEASLKANAVDLDIAVLIGLYKSEEYLHSFLKNLQSQVGFTTCQAILIATDPSVVEKMILDDFKLSHANVTLIYTKAPFGIYNAWNLGIEIAKKKYITNWNVDDVRSETSLYEQFAFMESNPSIDIGYQDLYYVFDKNQSWDTILALGIPTQFANVSPFSLMNGACPPHNGPIWKREIHRNIGLFNDSYRSAADLDFWIRCSLAGLRFHKMESKHSAYFHNPKGMSTSADSPAKIEIRKILETHFNEYQEQCRAAKSDICKALGIESDEYLTTELFLDGLKSKLGGNDG